MIKVPVNKKVNISPNPHNKNLLKLSLVLHVSANGRMWSPLSLHHFASLQLNSKHSLFLCVMQTHTVPVPKTKTHLGPKAGCTPSSPSGFPVPSFAACTRSVHLSPHWFHLISFKGFWATWFSKSYPGTLLARNFHLLLRIWGCHGISWHILK